LKETLLFQFWNGHPAMIQLSSCNQSVKYGDSNSVNPLFFGFGSFIRVNGRMYPLKNAYNPLALVK
jgi:hypothetical protein